ncbi:mCpol domain-containing protein [Persicitalea sp.]|uniref:mCpol domain-containing protein n=1 Tax=Persicitalea sp. TaxID=3100273 RepID=UPI0035945610
MYKFVRADADNIGDNIELQLLLGNTLKAQDIHNVVQSALYSIREIIAQKKGVEILMYGSDDILLRFDLKFYNLSFVEEVRNLFHQLTSFTLSVGIGDTLQQAITSLTQAKLSGKNRIVHYSLD